jgi:molybdenum cofactor biosynthesis enzyme MoaA
VESFDLEPSYTTGDIPGKCIKCLAEQELYNCLRELLREEGENKEMQQRFEMLLAFLKSPESKKLRDESEKHLAEGRKVTLRLSLADGKPKYKLNID